MTTSPLGIDISKRKFDACLVGEGGRLRHRVFPNTGAGFSQLSAWISQQRVGRAYAATCATPGYPAASVILIKARKSKLLIHSPGTSCRSTIRARTIGTNILAGAQTGRRSSASQLSGVRQ